MSFNEIDRKLLHGTYASFADFGADVEQVFANCHHFNSEETLIYQDAAALQLAYREAVAAWMIRSLRTLDDLHELNSPAMGVDIGIPRGEPLVNTGTGALGRSAASERVRKPGP